MHVKILYKCGSIEAVGLPKTGVNPDRGKKRRKHLGTKKNRNAVLVDG